MSSKVALTDDMSIGVSFRSSLAGLWRADLTSLKQRTAESMSEKASLH